MKKLMNIMVLSCYKATQLIEKKTIYPLSFMDRFRLSIHLKICANCPEYQKQSVLIDGVLRNNNLTSLNLSDVKLSDQSKTRIQKTLEEKLKK